MKEVFIIFLLALAIGSALNGYFESQKASQSPDAFAAAARQDVPVASSITDATDESFDSDVLQASTPVLVEFWGPMCIACKQMVPALNQLATEYSDRLKVIMVDFDKNKELASRYSVKGVPTYVLFSKGKVVDTIPGVTTKEKLAEALQRIQQ